MTNPNENKSYREQVEESYTDNNGNIHTNVTRTSETVNNKVDPKSYENGYVNGQTSERVYQEQTLAERDNKNANSGLLIGILLTALAGLIGGSLWYFTQGDRAVDNTVAPVAVPGSVSSPTPTVTLTPQPQTTIIERTKEVPVPVERTKEVPVFIPVPQQKAAPAPTVKPNINITVPPQQPAAKQIPATPTSTTPSSSSNSSSNTTSTSTSTSTSTPTATPEEKENKTDVTPSSSSSPSQNDNPDSSTQ